MTTVKLHAFPGNASLIVHIVLRELGVPFEIVRVERGEQAHKSPAYLALNPNGLIPVLEDGPLVLYETAAICLHLCDTHLAAGLMPPLATPERAHAYKWLVWLTNTLQAMVLHYYYPERMVDNGDAAAAAQVRRHAQARIVGLLEQLDAQLARSGGPWLLGPAFGAVDAYALVLCRWTRGFDDRPARSFAHLGPYLRRVLERPAVRAAFEAEALAEPWV